MDAVCGKIVRLDPFLLTVGDPKVMQTEQSSRMAAPLSRRLGADADAAQIADATVAAWQEIDAALSPIIGAAGVAALYKRSLYLTSSVHPWLASAHEAAGSAIDLAPLKSLVVQQSSEQAARGGSALLQTFHRLLASLIGPSLTERLLRSVWEEPSSGPSAGNNTP